MADLITYGLLVFTSFFTLVNPIGAMPIFLSLTSNLEQKQRIATARRALFAAFIIIIVFAFAGQFLFRFFSIGVDSFRIAGGAIFFVMGFDMLNARLSKIKVKDEEVTQYVSDISITPLAIPILCGPGAITNAIVLMEDASTISLKITFVISVVIVLSTAFIILAFSSRLVKLMGQTGINVMMRLMGLIIMVIAVEFFFAGIRPFLESIIK